MTNESQRDPVVLHAIKDNVAWITLNQPERLNAMTPEMDSLLRHHVLAADADSACKVIVITGAGKGFCSGADLSPRTGLPTVAPEYDARPATLSRFRFGYLMECDKPLVAAVNGAAAGVGLALALFCDIRIAAENARLGLTYSRVGLVAEYGLAWLLPRLLGQGAATEMLLSGRMLDAQEAHSRGLVQFIAEPGRFEEFLHNYVRDLADRSSPRSVRVIKQQLHKAQWESLLEAVCRAGDALSAARESADFREGVLAFREKRAPRFTGE